jgi:hypothetical protein
MVDEAQSIIKTVMNNATVEEKRKVLERIALDLGFVFKDEGEAKK